MGTHDGTLRYFFFDNKSFYKRIESEIDESKTEIKFKRLEKRVLLVDRTKT